MKSTKKAVIGGVFGVAIVIGASLGVASSSDSIAETVAHDEMAEPMAHDEMAETMAHDEMAETMAHDEMAETMAHDEMAETMAPDTPVAQIAAPEIVVQPPDIAVRDLVVDFNENPPFVFPAPPAHVPPPITAITSWRVPS